MRLAVHVLAVTVSLALGATGPADAQATQPTARDCLDIPVDVARLVQLSATIRICTLVLARQDLKPAERAGTLAHRGVAHRNAKSLDLSLADLVAARDLAPGDPLISRMLAWTYHTAGKLAEAEHEYDRAIKLEPHPQAFLSRCVVRLDLKRLDDALLDCETTHTADPNSDSAYFTALAYHRLGRTASALHLLEAMVGTPMASGRAYALLATIYDAAGRSADAQHTREQGRRRFPNAPELKLTPAGH